MRLTTAGVALLLVILYANNPSDAWIHNWHTGPINCYTCDSAEECAADSGSLRKCDGSNGQSCVAVFGSTGSVIQRGCSDNLEATCQDASCYECRSHGCNNLKDNTQLIDCVLCDAQVDENCALDIELAKETRQCHEHCMTALYPRTSDVGSPLEVVRSCLDDLDLDDREECADGRQSNCVACSGAKCNVQELGVRGSCNFCTDGNCDNPQPKTCRAVVPSGHQEQCFIQLDEVGKISELGCLSNYNASDVAMLQSAKRLWLCSEENCNVISALPAENTCKLCSSRTDANCAIAPTLVTSATTCSHPLFTDCYARVLDDGHTERGCLTTLEAEDYAGCLSGTNTDKCVTCQGDNCNVKLQPEDRLTCHVCNSGTDAGCEAAPDAAGVCLLHNSDQKCVTTIDLEGNTLRGCGNTLDCVTEDGQKCQRCVGKNCNTDNLKRRADGQPGQWAQELPLSCLSCNDITTCAASSPTRNTCAGVHEYCMTVFDETGKVSARGCSDTVESTLSSYCDANGGKCHNCNSNDCNNAASLESYTECIYCDASQNGDCIANPTDVATRRHCNGKCMTALRPHKGEAYSDLVRGCLDDKEPEDQERCAAGSDEECVACEGDACNVADMSLKFRSCYICSNPEDCVDPDMAVCLHYSPNDRCYMLFDNTSSVTSLGCVSDLDESFMDKNLEFLHFCNDNNCNSFNNLPKPNQCVVCDSLDDANCAVDPNLVSQYDTCNVLPNTRCMTRVLTDGSTQRGCVSSLTTTPLRSCLKGEANCELCEGAMCNKDIYPADRRRCQRCNSVDDPSCEAGSSAPSVCPRHNVNQGCSVKLVDGATYRGCQTEFICDDTDKQNCRQCNGKDNCNVVDLKSANIGYPGNWVTPPVNCYTCEGFDCQGSSMGPLHKCANNNLQNCATVFATNGSVVLRGCSDQLYADTEMTQYCDETPENCKFCKSTGCNNAKELRAYVDCALCDGAKEPNCVRNFYEVKTTMSCQEHCFTGLYPRTRVEADPAYELARGCLDDLDLDDQEACETGKLANCQVCTGKACNNVEVVEDRRICNYCDDEDCNEIVSQICTAHRVNDQCYIHVGDRKIKSMGCASDLDRSFMQANRRDLYICNDAMCNTKDKLNMVGVSCLICNSTAEAGCIGGESAEEAVCHHYLNPECYTHITEDGVVQRGCLMNTGDELFDECSGSESATCQICDSNGCNNELYPTDWQSCLRCDSNSDADCGQNAASYASYCPVYAAEDACVTSLEKGRTRRGCQSEIRCDTNVPASCRVCEDNDCNLVDLSANYVGESGKWQDLPLSCLVCDDLESCATVTTPTTCEDNNQQLCATVFNADGQVVARGCSDSVLNEHASHCEANAENCVQCKSNGCNNAANRDSYVKCYWCDADDDASCAWETPERTRQCQGQCMLGLYPRSSAWDSALLPTRGCLDDLEKADQELCSAGNHDNCTACTGALCNGGDFEKTPGNCFICETEDCQDMKSAKCLAYKEPHQCYTAFDSTGIIFMGCASDFETQVINELVAQKRLLICDGTDCNHPNTVPQPTTCLQCSSLNDTRCATNPNQLLTTDVCSQLPYTHCVTHIDAAGTTTRGCLASLDSEDFYACLTGSAEHCEMCGETNCNGLSVFPANRRRCHQCDSESSATCAAAPSSNAVCPIFAAEDSCVTTLRDGVTYRGCASSLSCADASDSTSCRTCSGSDACNTVNLERLNVHGSPGLWQQPPISCLSCNSVAGCASGGGTLEQCVGLDNCVTVFDEESQAVTARGCYNALDSTTSSHCDEQPDNCPRCNSNGCNTADSLDNYVECLVCDASVNPDCARDATKISKTRPCHQGCMSAFRPLFGETANPSYALVRNCYDDLEAEQREACNTDATQHCATCTDAKCNTQDLVDTRRSCLHCRGDECQEAQPAKCANYREQDHCFIEFDEQRSVVAQGCLSEYSNADIYLLQLAKRLLTCENDNCNTLESLPEAQTCVLCSSRTELNCAVKPADVKSATSCQLTGLPECYTRVLHDGATERGCLSSLEQDQFLGCYNGTADGCSSCLGDSCNKQVYPAGRASCHICNSENNAKCESTPDSLSICPLYAAGDACVTNLRGSVTYRGCASSLSCEPNGKTCVHCVGDGCNVADLAATTDDNHGKWQDLPLSCLSCEGAACAQDSPSERCADNNEQDCVTVFSEAGAVLRRGCEDTIGHDESLASYCASNAASCPRCKSNDCNNATATTQYNSCIYCDSFKSSDCLWQPQSSAHKRRQCQGDCMTAIYGSSDAGFDLIRTCLDDKEPADQLTCAAGKDASCVACSGELCNDQNVPADRLSCYHCVGGECEDPQMKVCEIYKPNDSCFLWVDQQNSIQQLGCLSSFRNQDLESVIKTKRISVCQGANCNTPQLPTPTKCAVCDSRQDPRCATTPLAVENYETCGQLPHTHCVTKLESDGATTRGCLFDLPQDKFVACLLGNDTNCELCAEDGCNRGIYPADRQQCYTCSSLDDSNCEADPKETHACAWASETESCQTWLDNNVTTRGCSSSIGCNPSNFRNCRNCIGSGCNSIKLVDRTDDGQHGWFQPLPLKCHACAGEHCQYSLGPAVECTLNTEQDCKTVFELDGKTVRRRGCSDDVDDYEDRYCRQHPEQCFVCKSNECNDAWSMSDYVDCVYCNSEKDARCVTYAQSSDLATRQCQGKCLVSLLDNKELLRTCLDDKEAFDRTACSSDNSGTNCASCENGNCNTFNFPADRLSCHICSGADCAASHPAYCRSYEKDDFCFAKYKDGAVEHIGCASSVNSTDLEQWRLSNQLHECNTSNCNDLLRLPTSGVCIACDSSKTPNCAQSPSDVPTTQICNAPFSDCLTRIENGHTIRGCANSLSTSESDACVANGSCAVCAGEKCNAAVFPENRRKCHICNSVANGDCNADPNYLAICPIYAAADTCVSSFGTDYYLQRGCGSQVQCASSEPERCQVCNTDGCNTAKFNGSAALGGIGLSLTLLVSWVVMSWRF